MSNFAVELRAGEGGDDALAFCQELAAAVMALSRHRGDQAQPLPTPPGSRTLTLNIRGNPAGYQPLAGVHRVQRIPKNDQRGRRHTSTATIAVLESRPPVTVELAGTDLEVHTYIGTGKGGQHRNKNATAVRLVHRPTGLVVAIEHGRSQWQNLQTARTEMIHRLTDQAAARQIADDRRRRNNQIASGERPVKQFTHNQQRSIVVSHQTGESWRWSDFYRGRLERQDAA